MKNDIAELVSSLPRPLDSFHDDDVWLADAGEGHWTLDMTRSAYPRSETFVGLFDNYGAAVAAVGEMKRLVRLSRKLMQS